ncbi:hypothetical protein PENARI_c008G02050 [Penicillium arizonense]|uniref:SUN domain-containing protein n=1 Tax=Penicillium arizonense TaxID=1835702 RepID=A0A1F5LJW5_PENAI|nr:hypothetical protein PENARI_c008G02050 [Penicillium arizonense]OGE53199.1 hypothetical protein PENARI_c008G02050 [Penicillium arizonense]
MATPYLSPILDEHNPGRTVTLRIGSRLHEQMTPKRATRKADGAPQRRVPDFPEAYLDTAPEQYLPSIPVGQSWNYGAPTTTSMPRHNVVQANIGIKDLAATVDANVEKAQVRAKKAAPKNAPKAAPKPKATPRAKAPKRAPTPDQTQLQDALQHATMSPTGSDKTPTPPVKRAVSSEPSPDVEPPMQRRLSQLSNPNSPLYPSPMHRAGSPYHDDPMRSSLDRHSSVDNASERSWNLERDINEDELQRTRPGYRGENITAPPRRPSGLYIVPEEDEDLSERGSVAGSFKSEADAWTAPARTVIPGYIRSASVASSQSLIELKESVLRRWRGYFEDLAGYRINWNRAMSVLLFAVGLVFVFSSNLPGKLQSRLFPGSDILYYSGNMSDPTVINGLRSQVSRMNSEMSSLSSEMNSVRSEHSKYRNAVPTYITDSSPHRNPVHHVNFLALSTGTLIDPFNTSPTYGSRAHWAMRPWNWVKSFTPIYTELRTPQPPRAALSAWEDAGDCWCSPIQNGTQLSVLLGHKIVPESLVVEHIPAGASLDIKAAPREIEVWARYEISSARPPIEEPTPKATGMLPRFWANVAPANGPLPPLPTEPPSSRDQSVGSLGLSGLGSLHELLMESIGRSDPKEHPSAYSDDPKLGPNYYRIGKITYDIHSDEYTQSFPIQTVIDIQGIRVDKIVFRVASNWGADHTCIYRLKLHGHQ